MVDLTLTRLNERLESSVLVHDCSHRVVILSHRGGLATGAHRLQELPGCTVEDVAIYRTR